MRVHMTAASLLVILAAVLAGYWAGQSTGSSITDRQSAYEHGLHDGVCHPLVYEDGSYVLEDGKGNLCIKP